MNENERVLQEVKKKQQRAKDLGLPDLINDLYMNHIKYFPSWIKNNRGFVPNMVKNCTELNNKDEDNKKIILELNDKKYSFRFEERSFSMPDGEWCIHGDLELSLNDEKCLAISLTYEGDKYYSSWKPSSVKAFKEKDWIKDFRELKKQIDIDAKILEDKRKNDPNKINKLKADFDID